MFKNIKSTIANISSFIKKMLSDDAGNPSSMRFNVTNMNLQWTAAITFGFIWVCLYYPSLILAYLGSILGAILVSLGIKKAAKKDEAKKNNSIDNNNN